VDIEFLSVQTTICLADDLGLIPPRDYDNVINSLVHDIVVVNNGHLNCGLPLHCSPASVPLFIWSLQALLESSICYRLYHEPTAMILLSWWLKPEPNLLDLALGDQARPDHPAL
jgi:hypothetical protein